VGEKGTVKIGGAYLNELAFHEVEGIPAPDLPPSLPANDYGFYKGTMNNHPEVYKQFMQAMQTGDSMLAHLYDSQEVVVHIEDIHQHIQHTYA
jgi:hypothetical protein